MTPVAGRHAAVEAPARDWTWINWSLSLLIAPVAMLAMALALAKGAAGCNGNACSGVVDKSPLLNLLHHGAAGAATLTLFFAFFFATRRLGVAVWMIGWALLGFDMVVLLTVF
ncbi:hypothetical protein [Mycolicibacter minnesotensis]